MENIPQTTLLFFSNKLATLSNRDVDEWEISWSGLKLGPVLGTGAFGQVVKGTLHTRYLSTKARDIRLSISSNERRIELQEEMTVAVKLLLGRLFKFKFRSTDQNTVCFKWAGTRVATALWISAIDVYYTVMKATIH